MKRKRFRKRLLSGMLAVLILTASNIDMVSIMAEIHPIRNVAEKLVYWAETGDNPFIQSVEAAPDGSSSDPFYVKSSGSLTVKLNDTQYTNLDGDMEALKIYMSWLNQRIGTGSGGISVQGWLKTIDENNEKNFKIVQSQLSSIDSHIGDINANLEVIQRQLANSTHNYRVANLHLINAKLDNALWTPYTSELPYIKEWSQVAGQFAAVDDATWNTSIKTLYNPGNSLTKRQLEILGYDAIVRAEGMVPAEQVVVTNGSMTPEGLSTYGSTVTQVSRTNEQGETEVGYGADIPVTYLEYVQNLIPENDITWLDAVTVLYKALGQDQLTYQSFISYNKSITPETSAVYKGLSNIGSYEYTPDSNQGDEDQHGDIADSYGGVTPGTDPNAWNVGQYNGYDDYIFVTRANVITSNDETPYGTYDQNLLYWNKAVSGGFIYDTSGGYDKWQDPISGSEFMKLAKAMMIAYGEPEMSDDEQKALLQVYGSSYPIQLGTDVADAWAYLKCRGILVDADDFYTPELFIDPSHNMTRAQLLDVCTKIKDKDSRSDYKVIQITLDLSDVMQENGYYPVYNLRTKDDPEQIVTNVDYAAMHHYTYLIRCNDTSKIGDNGSGEVCVMENGKLTRIDGGVQPQLLEWQDAQWYIVSIPTSIEDDVYIRKQTYDGTALQNKNSEWILIKKENLGGGIYNTPRSYTDNGNKACEVQKVDKEWYSFVDFATDQQLIYYADATRAGFSKLNKDTVAKGNPSSYNTWLDKLVISACSIFAPMPVHASVTNERENAHWNIKVSVGDKDISTSSTVEMSYPVMGAAYPLATSRKFATTWETHFGKSKKLTDTNLLNCIAMYMCDPSYSSYKANKESVTATLQWIKDNKDIFDTSSAKSRNEKAYGDTLLYMAYRGLEPSYKKYYNGSTLNNFRDEKAALYNKIKGKLNPPATVTFDPKVYSAKYSELDGFGDAASYAMSDDGNIQWAESDNDVQDSMLVSGKAVYALEGTKELVLNRVATATESSEVAEAILSNDVADAFEKLKSGKYPSDPNKKLASEGADPDSNNTSSISARPGVVVDADGNESFDTTDVESFTAMNASWLKYSMGVNPVPCMSPSQQGFYSLKTQFGGTSDDHARFVFTNKNIPDKYKTQAYYEDGTYDIVKYAVENNIFVGGQFKTMTSADLSVQYYAACDDPEKLNTFLAGLDATGPVDELNTGTNIFSDAIMNRDQIILVKWSDLVKCGYVIPTAESNMKNGPVLDGDYYTFYTKGGRVRVNNNLLTIQIGTTLFDLSQAKYDVKPILVYQGEKDESGFYDTYLDYRCVLGVASRARIKDNDTTEILNQSLGNAAGGYVVYKFDTSSINSDMWHTQKVNGYNFPEKEDYGKTPATGNNGYPVNVLKNMPYWDNQEDKKFDYGNVKDIVYWDDDTADKYPANRFIMASFYPTANWVVAVRDGGTDAIREAKLYVYYPIQAFTKGFYDTDGGGYTQPEDYWENAPWNADQAEVERLLDEANATYSGNLRDEINKSYPDHDSYVNADGTEKWWWIMTKYSYASMQVEMRKLYMSADFVVRTFNLTDSSIEVPNCMTWTDKYRTANEIGAVYWVNTIGFIYNMPNAANENETPFSLSKYFSGEYALPIAIVNDASKSGTYGIINYNMDYYGSATVKGSEKEPNVFKQEDSVEVPYGYAFSSNGWAHYTSSDGKSNSAGLPTLAEDKIFKNGELNEGLTAPLPFVIDNDPDTSVSWFIPAPVGVYSILSGDHETVDTNSIHTYVTQVNQFYYGSRRIVLRASNNQDVTKSYTIVSDDFNPIQFNNATMSYKSYRVYRNKTMDIFVMEHAGATMSGVDSVKPIEAEDLMTSELTNFLDGLGATTLIRSIDEGSSFLITIAFFVMPLIGIILMTILVGLSFISEVRFIQMFCDKFFDPIRLLTFGNRDIHTWNWRKVLVPCILLYTSFALFMNGNIIRLVMWIGKWYGIVSNYFANRF